MGASNYFRLKLPFARLFAASLLVLVGLGACDAPFGPGADSHEPRHVEQVIDLAHNGDAAAQVALGMMYERGLEVRHDNRLALRWYRRAADQGNALAAFHIGSLYERGVGVSRDYNRAAKWYGRAAVAGSDAAQAALAYLYERGLGVDRNFARAEALYDVAATSWRKREHFPAEATFALGRDGPAILGPLKPARTNAAKPLPTPSPVEVDFAAVDEAPMPSGAPEPLDGPAPIAGNGENFPLNKISPHTPPEAAPRRGQTAIPGLVISACRR